MPSRTLTRHLVDQMIWAIVLHRHWRRTGLNSMGASISTTSGRGRKRGTLICINFGAGQKSVATSAPTAVWRLCT